MTLYHINVGIRLNSYAPYAWLFGEFWGCFTRLIKCPQHIEIFIPVHQHVVHFFYGDVPGTDLLLVNFSKCMHKIYLLGTLCILFVPVSVCRYFT